MGATPAEIRRWRPYLTAQIGAESNFTMGIGSSAGARDIAQFMPGTAPSYGVRLGDNDARDDIRGQVRYMLPLLRKYGVEGALRGYNAGPGAIERSKGFAETNAYVQRVLGSAGRYRGIGGPVGRGGGRGGRGNPGMLLAGLGGAGGARELPGGVAGLSSLLEALAPQQQRQAPASSGVPLPAHAAGPVMSGQGVQSSGGPAPKPDTQTLIAAASALQGTGIERAAGGGMPGLLPQGGARGGRPGRRGGPVRVKGDLKELFYNGPGGINVDEGRRVGRGFVSGHTGHVHAAGQQRDMIALGRLAQRMGLSVRENPAFDPVDPVHASGSWHYGRRIGGRRYRAIDVSGPASKLRRFNRLVARAYGV